MQKILPTVRYVLAASAVLAVTGGIAFAGSGMGPDDGMRHGFHMFHGFLDEMDADKDGAVSRAEAEATRAKGSPMRYSIAM